MPSSILPITSHSESKDCRQIVVAFGGICMRQENEIEQMLLTSSFEEILQQMETDRFWLRIFIRPCCPIPNAKGAHLKVEGLRSILASRLDLTQDQQSELSALIERRENWYVTHLSLCTKNN